MQPTVTHAIDMVNAAVQGNVPFVRLNDHEVNQTYDPASPPAMLPDALDRHLEDKIAECARELLNK